MKYVALFRGINVGGKNIVIMNDLKQFLLELGLNKVKTYIQSGNAIFETELKEPALKNAIRINFNQRFGMECDVMVRSIDEMKTIIDQLPITGEERSDAEATDPKVEHLYIYFLQDPPKQSLLDTIGNECMGPDLLRFGQREIYLLCHQSIRLSKLAIRTSKVFKFATVRNWNTVNKLYNMMIEL
jgi:uncharacterized protein (DUF1697 family)